MTKLAGADFGLRKYFDQSLDLYCELESDGVIRYANPAWKSKLGYENSEIVGCSYLDFLHPVDIERSDKAFNDHIIIEVGFFRNRYRHKNGSYITLSWSGHVDPLASVTFAHARDVTSDVRKALLLGHVAAIQESYMNSGPNNRGFFNEVLKEILKATESDFGFIGEIRESTSFDRYLSVYAVTPGSESMNLVEFAKPLFTSGLDAVSNSETRDFNAFFGVPLYYHGDYIGFFGVAKKIGRFEIDFHARLKPLIEATASVVGLYQAAVRENALRERFFVVVENLPIMLTEFDTDGRITWANRFYREKVGLTENDITTQDILDTSLPDQKELERAKVFMLSGRNDWEDFDLRTTDGRIFPSTWTNVRLKDGRAIGIGQDLTDRRAAESKMIQSSKMASLGEMSAGVSHEINNPLAIIQGSAFRAIQNLTSAPMKRDEVEGDLNRIIQNCDRIARIVRGLRAFSRSAEHEPFIPTPLENVVEDVLNLAHERFKSQNIVLHIDLAGATIIDCRPVPLGQVLMNLLNNAYDAVSDQMESNRNVWIKARSTQDTIEITVEDSGAGIPTSVQNRILEPFFTTKEVGKGTGLGLSISKGIIESHSGRLWLDTDSKRTRFVIVLPIRQPLKN